MAEAGLDTIEALLMDVKDPIEASIEVIRFYRKFESIFLKEVVPKDWTIVSEIVENLLIELTNPNPWVDPFSM